MDGYIGEVRPFPYGFAPRYWMRCEGQMLPVSQYSALFSIIGITYGGNGSTSFALPDLRYRVPNSSGQMIGGGSYSIGDKGGSETVPLLDRNLPPHKHQVIGANIKNAATKLVTTPQSGVCYLSNAFSHSGGLGFAYANESNCTMDSDSISEEGQSLPHNNMMPYLVVSYCICIQGLYPHRS